MFEKNRIITIANQKGGVGKTTTAINLATALAAIGERVLIVDLDPQGNASTGLGIDRRDRKLSSYDLLIGSNTIGETVVQQLFPILILCHPQWTCWASKWKLRICPTVLFD